MPEIAIDLIRPNPFRDFDLHPIDDEHVERLKASIEKLGFLPGPAGRPTSDGHFELAFGHHRIEAARRVGMAGVPLIVDVLSDCQMALRMSAENAVHRGTTAAASLDAIAALCRLVVRECWRCETPEEVGQIFHTSAAAAHSIWGKIRQGGAPGRECIQDIVSRDAYSLPQIRLALNVLHDSGKMARIVADASGAAAEPVDVTFDPKCANLFRLDYHLQEFRRIVTGEVVRSYLPVEEQFGFAQKIIAATSGELTAIKLRERANAIMYEELGMPRHAMRNSPLRLSDDRVRDASNLMRRGAHSVEQSCRMLAALIDEGIDVDSEVIARFKDYIAEMHQALKSLVQKPAGKRSSNLRLIVNKEEVA